MDFEVGGCCVAACVAEDDYAVIKFCLGSGRWEGDILSTPPGCFGANSVRSYTMPSTTIQRSSRLLCLDTSSTEIEVVIVMCLSLSGLFVHSVSRDTLVAQPNKSYWKWRL